MTNALSKNPSVYFIGAGPGDPGLITVRGQELIRQADLVLYAGSLVPPEVVACAKTSAQVVDSAPLCLEETHALMRATVGCGGLVARVHTGDPALFGSIREQTALLDAENISYAVIPGVSAAFATAARAALSFTVPEHTQSLIITRLAGRTPVPASEELRKLASHGASMAIYLSADKVQELARELRAAHLPEETCIVIGYKIGHPEEKLRKTTLGSLEKTLRQEGFARQTMFLVLPAENAAPSVSRLYAASFGHGFRMPERPDSWQRMAIYALTSQGCTLAWRMAKARAADIFVPARLQEEGLYGFTSFKEQVQKNFSAYHAHVFIAASGIVVRTIAPLLDSKLKDPAVLVCDQAGNHVISLVSGHLGGANALARELSTYLGATAVITTATDTAHVPGIDVLAQKKNLCIASPERIKKANSTLAEGQVLPVYDPQNLLGIQDHPAFCPVQDINKAVVGVDIKPQPEHVLALYPQSLVLGIGCQRGVSEATLLHALTQVFATHNLSLHSIAALCSVDIKSDETGLLHVASTLDRPLHFFPTDVLARIQVPTPSAQVCQKIGVPSVCEAAALHHAQQKTLLVPKTIVGPVTIAIALRA